jgi:hypothetical protein
VGSWNSVQGRFQEFIQKFPFIETCRECDFTPADVFMHHSLKQRLHGSHGVLPTRQNLARHGQRNLAKEIGGSFSGQLGGGKDR